MECRSEDRWAQATANHANVIRALRLSHCHTVSARRRRPRQNLLIVFSFFSFQDICGRATSAHYQRMCVPEARGGNAQTFSENLTRVTREDFFLCLPVHSPKTPKSDSQKNISKNFRSSVFSNCYLRDSDSKNLAKEKGRRVRGRRKCYLSTPLLSLSRGCVAHFVRGRLL
jgi:hypothetical protein